MKPVITALFEGLHMALFRGIPAFGSGGRRSVFSTPLLYKMQKEVGIIN
jgi:hypothetical protein